MKLTGNMRKIRLIAAFALGISASSLAWADDPAMAKFFPLHNQNYVASGKKFLPIDRSQTTVSHGVKVKRLASASETLPDASGNTPSGYFTQRRYQPSQKTYYAMGGGRGYYRAPNVQPVLAKLPVSDPRSATIAGRPNTSNELHSNVPYKEGFYGASQVGVTAHTWPLEMAASQHISSGFGWRKHPVTGRGAMHKGVDLAAPTGTAVLASADGIVEETGQDGLIGKFVKLRHPDGSQSLYGHLSRVDVQVAGWVNRYQTIGAVGMTGRTTGAHLHYALKQDGKALDPMGYLRRNHQYASAR
jgi:murein DD-endopeptidase MepM/ murein hydrolase activator NlpD